MKELKHCGSVDGAIMRASNRRKKQKRQKEKKTIIDRLKSTIQWTKDKMAKITRGRA